MTKAKPRADEETVQQLEALLEAATTARPAPADEERMAALTAELLTGNKAAVTSGVAALVRLPWSVAVRIAAEAWPNIKALGRKQLVAALALLTDEDARRIRLSLARGLVAIDAVAASQILIGTCQAMLAANGGVLANRDRQSIFNALIGKGKPWLLHIDLAAWSPEDQLAFVECALQTAPGSAPFTQEALVQWAQNLQQLDKVTEPTLLALAEALRRWPGKLRKAWETPALPLPEVLAAALRENPPKKPEPVAPERPSQATPALPPDEGAEHNGAPEPAPGEHIPEAAPRPPKPTRSTVIVESSRPNQRQPERTAEFDLGQSLRQIDQYVHGLRRELREAKEQKPSRGRGRDQERSATPTNPAEIESLTAHNLRLESTVAHLREQLEELKQDHEDRAATMEAGEPLAQFKTLLALKLKDDFSEFHALRGQSANDVIRQHYGDLLRHVFEVLQGEGVELTPEPVAV